MPSHVHRLIFVFRLKKVCQIDCNAPQFRAIDRLQLQTLTNHYYIATRLLMTESQSLCSATSTTRTRSLALLGGSQ
eukprot:scaffold308753_cov54-Prasinocladus_malaysianus.AAC.1